MLYFRQPKIPKDFNVTLMRGNLIGAGKNHCAMVVNPAVKISIWLLLYF